MWPLSVSQGWLVMTGQEGLRGTFSGVLKELEPLLCSADLTPKPIATISTRPAA